MKYKNVCEGIFLDRPNRFIAHVRINEQIEVVHVKNTGRCKELLLPGVPVRLEKSDNPNRKTAYDLIMVKKDNFGWVNLDSQAPNIVMKEWLSTQNFDLIRPEYTFGQSRIDFYCEKGNTKYLIEVKGCTLEIDGIGYFPDAPTERGIKHLMELSAAVAEGYHCVIAFVIQMDGIKEVRPNINTQPAFGEALHHAADSGVSILFLQCHVGENTLEIIDSSSNYLRT